jgi:hypothetical protein
MMWLYYCLEVCEMMIGDFEKEVQIVPDKEPVPELDKRDGDWVPPAQPESEVPTWAN